MRFLDKLKEMAGRNPEKTGQGIDKAARMADERTGGKHGRHIDTGTRRAKRGLGLDDREDKP